MFGSMLFIIVCLLILQCGDVEVNPGPKGLKLCPQCNDYVKISVKLCSCGFRFNKKGRPCRTKKLNNYSASTGRPVGTSRAAGFKASFGRPVGTTHAAGFDISKGRKIDTTRKAGFNVSTGRPVGTTLDAGFNASTGRPVGTTLDAGFNASTGRPVGTTLDVGFAVSNGRPQGTTFHNGAKSALIEDDTCKLNEHIKQYDLPPIRKRQFCYRSVTDLLQTCL